MNHGTTYTVYVVVTVVTAVATIGMAVADLRRPQFVVANLSAIGVPDSWITPLAACKAVGGFGLIAGLIGFTGIGLTAAGGLVAYFIGAVIAHARVIPLRALLPSLVAPGTYLALAVGSLIVATTQV